MRESCIHAVFKIPAFAGMTIKLLFKQSVKIMLTKETVNQTMNLLSETFSLDELIDKLIFVEKVKNGLKQSEEGLIFSKKETKEKLSKWLK
jgi:hypothetical protein